MDDFYELIVQCIIGAIIIGILVVIVAFMSANDEKKWNNGFCSCGGHWEYQQAVGHRYDTDYIYKCDTCGTIMEFEKAR